MNTNAFGGKTKQIKALKDAGFRVPNFIAFSCNEVSSQSPAQLAQRAQTELGQIIFAVRSSALIEDMAQGSMAGQFQTILRVTPDNLERAIADVLDDAKTRLGSLETFSLIVMEYIEPDLAGVVFTRSPSGGREMVIEWVHGIGETLVSGKTKPKHLAFARSVIKDQNGFRELAELIDASLKIETLFRAPQDIEWAIKDGVVYFLQSRPITTLSATDIETSQYLDAHLPPDKFFFEKTEATEVAPTPSNDTFAMLETLYANDGPVALAYRTLGVTYTDTHFLERIGGQLYVDREKELKSLLPAYSRVTSPQYLPAPGAISGLWTTLKNIRRLNGLRFDTAELYKKISERLARPGANLLADYELIFTLNLAAEQAMQKLKRSLPSRVSPADVLQMNTNQNLAMTLVPPQGLVGNSLDLNDTSTFFATPNPQLTKQMSEGVSEDLLANAQDTMRLREYGRWLAVWHLSKKRVHATVADVFPHELPRILTDRPIERPFEMQGVSGGIAKGILAETSDLQTTPGEKILYTDQLSPQLADHLSDVVGIVSMNGGMLSHLAIIAREKQIPVIVNVSRAQITLGKMITMDGSAGTIEQEL